MSQPLRCAISTTHYVKVFTDQWCPVGPIQFFYSSSHISRPSLFFKLSSTLWETSWWATTGSVVVIDFIIIINFIVIFTDIFIIIIYTIINIDIIIIFENLFYAFHTSLRFSKMHLRTQIEFFLLHIIIAKINLLRFSLKLTLYWIIFQFEWCCLDSRWNLNESFSGTAGDSLAYHRDLPWSTHDQDNDEFAENCAKTNHGAWWYRSCYASNLNGLYYREQHSSEDGVVWYHWRGNLVSLKRTEMKIRPTDFWISSLNLQVIQLQGIPRLLSRFQFFSFDCLFVGFAC